MRGEEGQGREKGKGDGKKGEGRAREGRGGGEEGGWGDTMHI